MAVTGIPVATGRPIDENGQRTHDALFRWRRRCDPSKSTRAAAPAVRVRAGLLEVVADAKPGIHDVVEHRTEGVAQTGVDERLVAGGQLRLTEQHFLAGELSFR